MHLFTPDEVEFARKVWSLPNANHLTRGEYLRAANLGLISSNLPSNLCNDVIHGHYWAKKPTICSCCKQEGHTKFECPFWKY